MNALRANLKVMARKGLAQVIIHGTVMSREVTSRVIMS